MEKDAIDKLKEILASSGWSQERLAYNLGVSFSTLNNWINGKAKPRLKAAKTIDNAYLDIVGRTKIDRKLLEVAKNLLSLFIAESMVTASTVINHG